MKIEKVSIVIPAYNEEKAIGSDIEALHEAMEASGRDYEIIVVNDGSTDRTSEIVKGFGYVKLIEHRENRGGFRAEHRYKGRQGDVVVVTDGDGTYPVRDIPRLLDYMEEHDLDMVVGARRKEAGTLKLLRTPAKWFIRKLAMWMSGFNIPDLNSGLRAMKKAVFMEFYDILPWGHSWVSTITLAMLSCGYSVGYVDIDYYPRKGKSTFRPVRDTYAYLTLVIRTIMWFNPLKVFMPLSLFLGALGTAKFIFDMVRHPFYVTSNTVILLMAFIQVLALGLLADLIAKRRR